VQPGQLRECGDVVENAAHPHCRLLLLCLGLMEACYD
jgi:hypothetical protein